MSQFLYEGFHKIEEVVSTIKGKEVKREKLHLKSAVAGLVIDDKNRVALVTQYRPTIGRYTKEIPAGVLDKGLTPIETLFEELEEECGIGQSDISYYSNKPFRKYFMVAGSSDANIELFLIRVSGRDFVNQEMPDDNDVESVEWVTLKELGELVNTGEIVDAKTLMAYGYAME